MALPKWGQREAGEGRPGPEEAVAWTEKGRNILYHRRRGWEL